MSNRVTLKRAAAAAIALACGISAAQAASTVAPGSWTLAVVPDTQSLAESYPAVFNAQMQWLADNKANLNLAMVVGEGDVTNRNTAPQWANAKSAYGRLTAAGVPYLLVQGNHDIGNSGGSADRSTLMNSYFSVADTGQSDTYLFEAGKLENSYTLFSAGGKDYVALALEFGPRDEALTWANGVLSTYSNRAAMISTHAYLYSDGTRYDWATKGTSQTWNPHSYTLDSLPGNTVNDGQEIWDKLVKSHGNVEWVFNGHVLNDGNGRLTSTGVNGNSVNQILANYQPGVSGMPANADYLRLMEFQSDGKVLVRTYSPNLDTYLTDANNQFSYPLTVPPAQPTPPLVGYWKLNEGSGQTVVDASGNGRHGFLGNSAGADVYDAAWTASGQSGAPGDSAIDDTTATSVTSRARHVRIPNHSELTPKQITLSAWIDPQATKDSVIVGKHNGTNDGSYYLGTMATGSVRFMLITGSASRVNLDFATDYVNGGWHHLAGTYDGATMSLYWDGVLVAQTGQTGDIKVTSHDLLFGAYNPITANTWEYQGKLDEVAIFAGALSDGGVSVGDRATGDIYTLFTQGAGALVPEPGAVWSLAPLALLMLRRRRARTFSGSQAA